MNKKEFKSFKIMLHERGYRVWKNEYDNSDYQLFKPFHRNDNKFEENRAAYQLFLKVYDYSTKDWPNLPKDMRDHVSIEIEVMVSRNSCERLEFNTAFRDNDSIDEIETLAESFYNWVESIYPEPREF